MKNILFIALALLNFCTKTTANNSPLCDDGSKVTLNSGTILLLETAEKIYSDQVTVGKMFRFRVVADVMAEGEVAIRTGAFAMGRVKAIETSTFGTPEAIRIELTFVQAVDGQSVSLMGDELSIQGQQTGQGTPVEFATSITSHVTNTMKIMVD